MRDPSNAGMPPPVASGFGVLDERGRLTLSKPVRQALRLRPGSSVAYIVVDDQLLVLPQDEHLARLIDGAAAALARMGLTADDLLTDLPVAGEEAMRAVYGDKLVDELAVIRAQSKTAGGE